MIKSLDLELLELKESFFKLNKSYADIFYENSKILLEKQKLKHTQSLIEDTPRSTPETSFSEDFFKSDLKNEK